MSTQRPNQPIHSLFRNHLRVLVLYVLLALLLSWPLIPRIFTHVPGVAQWAFDESTFVWNIWYFKHALVDNLSSPLTTDLIYYPLGIDLVLYTYNFYHALVAQPLFLAANLPFASNISLLLSTILSGFGTFLLTRYLLTRNAQRVAHHSHPSIFYAPIIAGLLYAFASNRAIYAALGHYDMVTTQWIPFYALALLQTLDPQRTTRQRLRSAGLAGIFFAFNGLAEMITALFMAIFTLIVLLIMLVSAARNQELWRRELWSRLVSGLAITGIVAAILWGPVLVPILTQFITDDFSLKGWGEAIPLSTDLLGWLTPTVLHPLWGSDLIAELRRIKLRALESGVTGFRDINTAYIGMVSLLLAIIGAVLYRAKVRLWIWSALLFGIFTLGPFLQINGRYRFDLDGIEATFPLPYALLHYIPIIKANRAPNRNSVVLMLGIAVLAGFAIHWLMQRLVTQNASQQSSDQQRSGQKRPTSTIATVIAVTLAGLILFEHLTLPYPLSDARVPTVYAQIADDPASVSVMNFPLGWRNSFGTYGPERTLIQYFQSTHGKPMLGGNISRAPDFKMGYFEQLPFFQAFRNVQSGEPVPDELRSAAADQSDELMHLYNVGYVLLHPPIEERPPYSLNWENSWQLARDLLPLEDEPFWSEGGLEAYRVIPKEGSDTFKLDLGEAGTLAYRGGGWDRAETDAPYGASAIWATGAESELFVPLRNVDRAATYQLSIQLHPYGYPGAAAQQTVALVVNGSVMDTQTVPEINGWQTLTWEVNGDQLVDSLNWIDLKWGWSAIPREIDSGSRQIGSTGVELPVDVDIKGFADGGFIALFDEAGDQSDGSAGRMGINATVLNPQTGAVDESVGFDTTANTYESAELAAFLREVPAGNPVLIVSRGPAWQNLTEEAVTELRALGADVTIDGLQGQYLAMVGVKGATPGAAALVVDPNDAFLRVSLNRDRRPLAAAIDWVEIKK